MRTQQQELAFAKRARNVGCPVNTAEYESAGPGGLIISPGSDPHASMVVDCGQAGALIVVNLMIQNDTRRRISLSELETGYFLPLPWSDCYFRYFTDPSYPDPKISLYRYCGTFLEFDRDEVLNHRDEVIAPGHSVDGLLIDVCFVPIPGNFVHGDSLTAKFLIVNDVIGTYFYKITLGINRMAKRELRKRSADHKSFFEEIALTDGEIRVETHERVSRDEAGLPRSH